jgi:hypothetical protein
MIAPRMIAALIGLIALSACFYSEVPLVPAGQQITLPYSGVVLCLDDDCRTVMAGEDGSYEIRPPDDEDPDEKPVFVRFQLLNAENGHDDPNPVYLAEAEMRDGDEVSYRYLVAHIRPGAITHVPTYEFAMPGCNSAPDGALERFSIERADSYSCRVLDLDAFKKYLIEVHGADFQTEEFWEDS